MTRHTVLLASVLLFAAACGNDATTSPQQEPITPPVRIRVLAAASLSEALTEIAHAWKRESIADVELSFDATSRLARQIEEGVAADVFVAADHEWMDELVERRFVQRGAARVLAGNHLVVVTNRDGGIELTDAEQLSDASIQHVALAESAVPAGRYAEESLRALHILDALAPRIVRAPNVRATLAQVASGNAEAGIVYASDARIEPRVRVAIELADNLHAPIEYMIAPLRASTHTRESESFVAASFGTAARNALRSRGFEIVSGPAHEH